MNKKYLLITFLIGFATALSAVPNLGIKEGLDEATKKAEEVEAEAAEKAEEAEAEAAKKAEEAEDVIEAEE